MKRSKIAAVGGMIMISMFMLSCQKEGETGILDLTKSVVGTYKGTLTDGVTGNVSKAMADVIKSDNSIVEIHCYSDDFDSTFVMEVFENGDSLMLCNVGNDFINRYGHPRMNEHHMMGNSNGQDWRHHMDEEHEQDDEHFGGFNMRDHSFSYRFETGDGHGDHAFEFKGKKQ